MTSTRSKAAALVLTLFSLKNATAAVAAKTATIAVAQAPHGLRTVSEMTTTIASLSETNSLLLLGVVLLGFAGVLSTRRNSA